MVHCQNAATQKTVEINVLNGLSVLMEVLFDCIYKKYFTHSTLTIMCQLQMQIATKTVPKSKSTKQNISTNMNIKLIKLLYTLQNTSKYTS